MVEGEAGEKGEAKKRLALCASDFLPSSFVESWR